jgi:P-type Cu2+ transporter
MTKPRTQAVADRASGILTFTALGIAIVTVLVWSVIMGQPFVFALTLAITVLVIACPHALGLAIPTVTTIATTLAVRRGLFIKDMEKLEATKDVNYVVFDKTGTLTKGEFGVSRVVALQAGQPASTGEKEVLEIAASLEAVSSHVIGMAIVTHAQSEGLKQSSVTSFKNLAGKGITGTVRGQQYWIGNRALMEEQQVWSAVTEKQASGLAQGSATVVFLADKQEIIGMLALADEIKPESKRAIDQLHQAGIKVAMLTGDAEAVAQSVAQQLEIDTYFAEVLPEQKYEKIKSLQMEGGVVLMVGDGVNDAPALTQADVGVAIGAGTDVAVEAGDIVLTRNNPLDVVGLIMLSRRVYRKMIENLVWALGYNVVAIPAAAGLFIPWGIQLRPEWGAILMSLSSVIVVIYAFTLKLGESKSDSSS